MSIVELHGAFAWDCDTCGKENFERAIEGNIDEAALNAADNQVVGDLVAIDVQERQDGLAESGMLIQRILLAPNYVTCKHCGESFSVDIAGYIPGEEGEEE